MYKIMTITKRCKNNTLLFALFFTLLSTLFGISPLFSQSNPFYQNLFGSQFNNRPLGYLNDATSVAYNPSMLGLRSAEGELAIVSPYAEYNIDSLNPKSWGVFGKISSISLGYISGGNRYPTEYYLGYSFPLMSNKLFLGLSAVGLKEKSKDFDFSNTRINTAISYVPFTKLIVSGGITNMHRSDKAYYLVYSQGIYSPFDWISFHYDAKYSSHLQFEDKDFRTKNSLVQVGASLGITTDFVLSGLYNLSTENTRIGIEYGTGAGLGIFVNSIEPRGIKSSGDMILRLTSDDFINHADIASTGTLATLKDECFPQSYYWRQGDADLEPDALIMKLYNLGEYYQDFAKKLDEISVNRNNIFDNIAQKYYPLTYTPKEDANYKMSNFVVPSNVSQNKYKIYEGKTQILNERETSVILKIKDASGNNVPGLKISDISLNNQSYYITKLEETTSETKFPVDIVFVVDASGSMSDEIASIKKNIQNFVSQLELRGVDSRLGGILFGNTILRTVELTSDFQSYRTEIDKFNYDNNAYAECTSMAIEEAADMRFRENAEKLIIVVTDECMMQTSSDINEFDLVRTLWKKGVKLYSMVNYSSHNGFFVTKFSLGKDFDITTPFNQILDNIAGSVSTTYQLNFAERPKEIPKVLPKYTALKGVISDIDGWKVSTELTLTSKAGKNITTKTNPISGEYFTLIDEGQSYTLSINPSNKYKAYSTEVNLSNTTKGDTVTKDITLQLPNAKFYGNVYDENNVTTTADVIIKNLSKNTQTDIKTNSDGYYEYEFEYGDTYSFAAKKTEYINIPIELNSQTLEPRKNYKQDLQVIEILASIEKGLTFKMKNILFDTGKWDIKPESEVELNKLITFLSDYPNIRVEIGAHTDDVGKDEDNMTLSANRAESVVKYLISKGIDKVRLVAKGYGETKPVTTNTTPEGKAFNRRVEFKLIR